MKKMMIALLACAVGLSMTAAVAMANPNVDINLNGASAEFTLWTAAASTWLSAPAPDGGQCGPGPFPSQTCGNYYIVSAPSCGLNGGGPITLRVSSTNSLDGINSALGQGVDPNNGSTGLACSLNTRAAVATTANCNLACENIDLGASDVGGEAFGQATHGNYVGPAAGACPACVAGAVCGACNPNVNWKDITASAITIPGNTDVYNPVVVPFGFYLHTDIQAKTCSAGSGTSASNAGFMAGQLCTANADCGSGAWQGTCNSGNVPGLSRQQIVAIFSGQVNFWSDLGPEYSANGPTNTGDISICMRHAGSGTLATLHRGIMYNSVWGGNLPTTQVWPGNPNAGTPETWFNNGTGDMMNCVSMRPGAIGYADADRLSTNPVANVYGPITYNGFGPSRVNIRNGNYDEFWSAQHIYQSQAEANYLASHPIVQHLMNWVSTPTNIPPSKAAFWATQSEMAFQKTTDTSYPSLQGASNQQFP